ncbi:MAG TPA: hypothetical protein VGN72_17375 [Tepidisphaeraceae bacterium]|nr:hypothetical protein [Tepidisphaeraceae bacterium]
MGYALEIFSISEHESPASLSKVLFHRGINGIIIGRTTSQYDPDTFLFDWQQFAAIAVDAGMTAFPCHNVLPNHFKAVLRLWRTLRHKGYRRIGAILRDDLAFRVHPQEIGAFCVGQRELDEDDRIPICVEDPQAFPQRIAKWVARYRPEVVIARDAGALAVLRRHRIGVPAQAAFAALSLRHDDRDIAGFQHCATSIAEAVLQLDTLLRLNRLGQPPERHVLLIDPVWQPGPTLPNVPSLML